MSECHFGIVSFRISPEDLEGQNVETPLYPSAWTFRRAWHLYRALDTFLAFVSQGTYWQAVTRLSWLSYSPPKFFSVAEPCHWSGFACHQVESSPRQPVLCGL
jgi:hypothetical protein